MGRLTDFRARTIAALNSTTSAGGWAGVTDRVNAARDASMPATFGGGGSVVLPDAAEQKLAALREQRDELYAVTRALVDRVESARLEVHDAERELRRVQANDSPANQLPDTDPQVMRARTKVEQASVDFARLVERRDARSAAWQAVAKLVENAERWIAGLPAGTTIEPVETTSAKLGKAETPAAAIERFQRKRRDLLADLQAIEAAPISSAAARALARAEIDTLADRGRPDLFGLIEHAEGIRWPELRVSAQLHGFAATDGEPALRGFANTQTTDSLALFAWMNRDALLAAIDVEIDQVADDAAALSDTERAERRADVLAQILATERDEWRTDRRRRDGGVPPRHRPARMVGRRRPGGASVNVTYLGKGRTSGGRLRPHATPINTAVPWPKASDKRCMAHPGRLASSLRRAPADHFNAKGEPGNAGRRDH